jgi:hypothetical protein
MLAAVGFIVNWLAGPVGLPESLRSFLIVAFLTWRVSRGGQLSRMILLAVTAVSGAVAVLAVARSWGLGVIALAIIGLIQFALLISPPVYGWTRKPVPIGVRAAGWARLVRRPPGWLLPCGLLAGVLITLACLGSMTWAATAGCGPAGSAGCVGLVEGYPLRWLTASQNVPMIAKAALFRDCAQWALAATSVLYLAWLWLTEPADLPD